VSRRKCLSRIRGLCCWWWSCDPGNEWVLGFLDEVTGFDKMPHDDQVDSFTQALIDLKVSDGQVSVSTLSGAGRASRVRSKLSGRSIR